VAASPTIALVAEVAWSNISISMVAELPHVLFSQCILVLSVIALASRGLWQHGEICVFLSKPVVVSFGLDSIQTPFYKFGCKILWVCILQEF